MDGHEARTALVELAYSLGIPHLQGVDLADYALFSDGCSGRLSWLYSLSGKQISCHMCCVAHDFLYEWGGSGHDRKLADALLRICAANVGSFEGWRAPFRRAWRSFRAWIMYGAVRTFGSFYWGR
jgi:hypothetical protein